MTDDAKELTRELLTRFNRKLDWLIEETRDVKMRLSLIEQRLSLIDTRLDRFEVRAERLEHRMERMDHPEPRIDNSRMGNADRPDHPAERFDKHAVADVEPLGQALGQALARNMVSGQGMAAVPNETWFENGLPSPEEGKRRRYSDALAEPPVRVSYPRFDRG
jgi:hypothetical protein